MIKLIGLAAGYGLVAGSVTALVLGLMNALKQAVWSLSDDRWFIFLAVMVGGLLIAALRTRDDAFGPLCVGALVGYACGRIAPTRQLHYRTGADCSKKS